MCVKRSSTWYLIICYHTAAELYKLKCTNEVWFIDLFYLISDGNDLAMVFTQAMYEKYWEKHNYIIKRRQFIAAQCSVISSGSLLLLTI